jgi:hypothetical protein
MTVGPRAQGRAEAVCQGTVGGARPVAEPLRVGVLHHRAGAHRRRRWSHPHLPHDKHM